MILLAFLFASLTHAKTYDLTVISEKTNAVYRLPNGIEVDHYGARGDTSSISSFIENEGTGDFSLRLDETDGGDTFFSTFTNEKTANAHEVALEFIFSLEKQLVGFTALSVSKGQITLLVQTPHVLEKGAPTQEEIKRNIYTAAKDEEGKKTEPPKEKTFLQKYFVYIIGGMLAVNFLISFNKDKVAPSQQQS